MTMSVESLLGADDTPRTGQELSTAAKVDARRVPDHRESSDTYDRELLRMGIWRIAVCKQGIQWLLQKRRPGEPVAAVAWDSISFCQTRAALIRCWRQVTGDSGAILLSMLPERCGNG